MISMRETLSLGCVNNKGTDQFAHMNNLISSFVISLLEKMISRLATGEILIFYLVFVAEQASLNLTLSDTPKTGFLVLVEVYQLRLYCQFFMELSV